MEKILDIGEVINRSGLPASTLRYYEQEGLIRSVGRNGLRRLFNVRVLEQLSLIALGQLAGLSLQEIGAMFNADGEPHIDRRQLLDKADELDHSITQLTAMRDGLRHAANCSAPSHLECPKFVKMVRMASRHTKKRHKNA